MDGALRDGVIYVNVNSENPMAHIIGHEIGHAIEISKTFDKTAYKALVKAAKESGIKKKDLRDFVFDSTSKENEALLKEIVNNIIGDAMNSEAFWAVQGISESVYGSHHQKAGCRDQGFYRRPKQTTTPGSSWMGPKN